MAVTVDVAAPAGVLEVPVVVVVVTLQELRNRGGSVKAQLRGIRVTRTSSTYMRVVQVLQAQYKQHR